MLLTFPRPEDLGGDAHAVATCSLLYSSDPDNKGSVGPAVRIQGPKGEIQVFPQIPRPTKMRLVLADGTVEDKEFPQPGPGKGSGWYNGFAGFLDSEGEGHGMFWEADEAALALLEGRKEGRFEGLDESIVIMEIMDEVRRQNGLKFPESIESTNYPEDLN
jgi:dihydrodiol dehydrogenase / D-xylose 1-dehydrogenase (NADP)